MPTTDANQSIQLTTPLGKDKLIATGFSGTESLSAPFAFTLSAMATEAGLDAAKLTGKGVTVKLVDGDGNARILHGLATRLSISGKTWTVELRPWLWMLTLASDNRIFQAKTTPEIIKAVFSDLGYTDVKDSLTATYAKRDYCVQYRETAFDFVHRLLEEEGIWYFFTHAEGSHTLVLADDPSAAADCANAASVPYLPLPTGKEWLADKRIDGLTVEKSVVPGKYQADDFNFETPSTELKTTAAGTGNTLQIYDYPGRYAKKDAGDALAKIRLEALEADASLISGSGTVRHFVPGAKIAVTGHPDDAVNASYVLRSVTHAAADNEYSNSFVAHPVDLPFRPARVTRKPSIAGSQTAIVVGKSGEEIWTDKYGRIKVQFHWDQLGKKDENSSCWIRVAQSWAGKSWGAWTLPRLGQEVVVSFLDGDPDRPLVTGCVYNGDFPLPYALPDDQTKTTLKSNSSKGGGGFNELRFEDKKDSEEVYLHAQKDLKTDVENDRTITVIKGNDALTVSKGNRSVTVTEGNESLTVGKGTRDISVKGNETHGNEADFSHTVKGKHTLKVSGDLLIDVTGSITIKSGSSMSIKSGADVAIKSGTGLTAQAGTDLTAKAGTGATVQGGTTLDLKGSASGTLDGGGMLTVKGGMVKIN